MSPLSPIPRQHRELLVALRFHDVFQDPNVPLRVALDVRIDALGLVGFPAADGTWRFSVVGVPPPTVAGTFAVTVGCPSGEYVAFDPISVTLPIVPTTSPPVAAEFLVVIPLWPTRRLAIPTGEGAVTGVVRQAGVPQPDLRVVLHPLVAPPPGTPVARTDPTGTFLYRLPRAPSATTADPLTLHVVVTDAASAPVPVTPTPIVLPPGQRLVLAFEAL